MLANQNVLDEISREMPETYASLPKAYADMDGFMFVAYGCAVFERELDDGRLEYTAVSLSSGAKLTLDRRRNPITARTVEGLVIKLRDSRIAGLGRLEIAGDAALPLSKLKYVLDELFKEILPRYGYGVRDGQIALAEQLLDAMAGRRVLLAEAAVGIGKTLVYIIVGALIKRGHINREWSGSLFPGMSAVEWQRMPVLISTSSIALQKSIVTDYIPAVSKILLENGVIHTPLRAALRKGKEHYVCDYNLRAHLPFERNPNVAAVLDKLTNGNVIDLADVDARATRDFGAGLPATVKRKICVPAKCYRHCPYKDNDACRYKAFRAAANDKATDFQICNHNLLFADAKLRSEGKGSILPPYQMLVVDEAHQLLSAARSIYGTELSADTVTDIAKAVLSLNFRPLSKNHANEWKEERDAAHILAEQLKSLNRQIFNLDDSALNPFVDVNFGAAYASDISDASNCGALFRNMRSTAVYLRKTLKDSRPFLVERDQQRKHQLAWGLERLSETAGALAEGGEQIRWFERERDECKAAGNRDFAEFAALADKRRRTGISGIPKRLNDIIYNDLWARGVPTVLTSGTLQAGGDFGALKRSVGLERLDRNGRIDTTVQTSPYNYRDNCMLYISENVPFPRRTRKSYINALTDEIERLIKTANGHTAVLFTSYSVMGQVYGKLQKRGLPFPFFKLERSTSNAIEQFKKSGNGVLFASGALWEGIDIPGAALSLLIIAKLPFPVPNKISEYERTRYGSFDEYRRKVIIPEMLLKLKQGFGRLLRSVKDTGAVAILDSRASINGAYRRCVLEALQVYRVTSLLAELHEFLLAVKEPEFWLPPRQSPLHDGSG